MNETDAAYTARMQKMQADVDPKTQPILHSLLAPRPRCSGCGTRDHSEEVRCPNAPPPMPTAWDETTETADDISWGAAYGDW